MDIRSILCGILLMTFGFGAMAFGQTVPKEDVAAFVKGNTAFALDLYARLKDHPQVRSEGGNLFFSPYSISTALAMTADGARGQTATQMASVLRFPDSGNPAAAFGRLQKDLQANAEKSGCELNIANALWGQKGHSFLEDFLRTIEAGYGAGLNEVDFGRPEEARKTINTWVERQTKDRIKDLIAPGVLNHLTRLVLTNAIYFKGDWAVQFKEENTAQADFFLAAGSDDAEPKRVQVPMMHQKGDFAYGETDEIQVLSLPYEGKTLSMLILLPKAGSSLTSLESGLDAELLEAALDRLRSQEVEVYLPRFTMTSGPLELKGPLGALGMVDAFNPTAADFSGMDGSRDLSISNVVHKAFVEVNEEGTEAAAATGVVMRLVSVRQTPVFRADRPFLFLIRENQTGSVLFMGRMMNPAL